MRTIEIEPRAAPGAPGDGAPVVVFLHGRGQAPETAHEVAGSFETAKILAPEGGVVLRRGSTWFENESIGVARRASVERAEDRLLEWLGGRPDTLNPWLCGFSNGGAFAGHLLMRHPTRFAGAALLSAPLVLPPWRPGALSGKPVFYGRGERDPLIPSEMYEAAETYLEDASDGAITRRRYDIAHEVGPGMVRDLAGWFRVRTDAPGALRRRIARGL